MLNRISTGLDCVNQTTNRRLARDDDLPIFAAKQQDLSGGEVLLALFLLGIVAGEAVCLQQ